MTKITFEDLPSTNTPLSASNLNTLQDNVETAIDAVDTKVDTNTTYFTTETRVGTWIDGKPLYRKVIDYTITAGTNSWHEIETLNNIATLCIKGAFVIRATEIYLNLYNNYNFYYSTTTSKLNEQHSSAYYEGYHMYLIVEYTKTTD